MIRLIEPTEVCAYLKIDLTKGMEQHIDSAHALVAEALGTSTLDARSLSETHKPKYDTELIEVRDGPISEVTSITVDGTAMDLDDVIVGYWTIQYPDGWAKNSTIVVTFTAGWGGSDANSAAPNPEPPDGIIAGLIQAAAQVYNTPNTDLVYEKIGDYTKQTAQGVPGRNDTTALDPRIIRLLRRYMRPSF